MQDRNCLFQKQLIFVFVAFCLFSCNSNITSKDDGYVECILCRIDDSQTEQPDDRVLVTRHITFYYRLINKYDQIVFIPFNSDWPLRNDSLYCSRINLKIDNYNIASFLRTRPPKWNGILMPSDSIILELQLFEWMLDSAKLTRDLDVIELKNKMQLDYSKCNSDSIHSKFTIPNLVFTETEFIPVFHPEIDDDVVFTID